MTVASRVLARIARFPRPTHPAAVARDVEVKMADGAVLRADHWTPVGLERAPTIVVRTPYGRRQLSLIGRVFAERGYQMFIQSCRGTFGSDGEWVPFFNEAADGRETVAWVAAQPWCGATIGMWGASYLGLTQWAAAGPEVAATALGVTAARFSDIVTYPGGAFALETCLGWVHQVAHQEDGWRALLRDRKRLRRALAAAPIGAADRAAAGHPIAAYQDWVTHEDPDGPWWAPIDFRDRTAIMPPATMTAGWYDLFLPAQLADFEALTAAGRRPRLTVGPWTHSSPGALASDVRDALAWFDEHLRGGPPARGTTVFVMGSRRWVELDTWPPPATTQRWHLHAGRRLATDPPKPSPPDRYRYDPADPTPGIGGPSLSITNSGPKSNRRRESRADVVCYTSDVLDRDVTVIGPVVADLHITSTRADTDVFVRLCDVSPRGRSINVSDGILRLRATTPHVRVAMWPTANTFRRGHRIRLQVSSGAHPVYARNLGSPIATSTDLTPSDHAVFHDPDHPSALELPLATPSGPRR